MSLRRKYESKLRLLIAQDRYMRNLVSHSGCCVICFASNPLALEEHHPFGRRNSDVTVTVCGTHHAILSRMQGSWPKSWLEGKINSASCQALADRALADLLKVYRGYWRDMSS